MAISAAIQSGACPPRLRPDGRSGRERAHHQRSPKPRRRRGAEEPCGGLRTDGGGGDVEVPSGRCQRRRGHRGSSDPRRDRSPRRGPVRPRILRRGGRSAAARSRGRGADWTERRVATSSTGFSPTATCSSTPNCSPTSSARRRARDAPALPEASCDRARFFRRSGDALLGTAAPTDPRLGRHQGRGAGEASRR